MKRDFLVLLFLLIITTANIAQKDEVFPRISPNASVSQVIGYTKITIDYCRPAVNDRKIWGALVPYNQIWRTGANEATTIQFTTDVIIEGHKVPAGIYSLYTIPTETEWTVILNKAFNVWGLTYMPEEDFLRFKVKPTISNYIERLQFSFSEITERSASAFLNWENLQISFKVEVDFVNQVHAKIKEVLAARPRDAALYYKSAEYAADHNFLLNEALQWVDKAISINQNFYAYYVKAKIFFKQNKFTEANRALEKCREQGRNNKDFESYDTLIDLLEKQIKEKLN